MDDNAEKQQRFWPHHLLGDGGYQKATREDFEDLDLVERGLLYDK